MELVPDLYMERVYEDHENLVENCLMWKIDSKNTLWFIERPEKFDLFQRPENYLLGTSSSQRGEAMEEHAQQELLEEYFASSGVGAPEVEGFIWLKAEGKKSWKKFYFVLRSSGLYYAPHKGKKNSKDLICLSTFDVNQVYYGTGWRKKYKAPTDYCFAIKNPTIQAKTPKYIRYLCLDTENELHQWVTGIRIAKNGKQIYDNYRSIEEEITHADIDILTSKRFSGNNQNNPTNNESCNNSSKEISTPSSENKSFDSALSSGIVSDISSDIISSDINDNTPVNTMDRRVNLSRSSSKNGFESDFPIGGTIKKRQPAQNTTPRLPLTSTTRGMVAATTESDDSGSVSSDHSSCNIRVGGGGTLLRNAVRQSFRKTYEHRAQIHTQPLPAANNDEYFPPPPPPLNEIYSSEVADLPPPPPELLQDPIVKPPRRISFNDNVRVIEHDSRLFNNCSAPPKTFLRDLQRVMTKKWQVAEKCKEETGSSPHNVLGFRDDVAHLVGVPRQYSRDNSVGTWVLTSQMYSARTKPLPMKPFKPVYNPVVLREPTPEFDPYGTCGNQAFRHQEDNYSTLNYQNGGSSNGSTISSASSRKRLPPPPPRRSENTQLTSQS